jgi:hypothetical protein
VICLCGYECWNDELAGPVLESKEGCVMVGVSAVGGAVEDASVDD